MKKHIHQAGKTFSGILIGLVLAVVVVAGLLWFLNNNKTTFQEHDSVVVDEVETEVLTPPDFNNGNSSAEENGDLTQWEDDLDTHPEGASQELETVDKPIEPAVKPKVDNRKPQETKKPDAKPVEKPIKVTPEQILDNGSIEKAREKAEQDATKQVKTGKKIVLQAGSYAKQETADAQRAQLLMLGVDAHVEKAQISGGKTVYRVKTSKLAAAESAAIEKTLKSNGIDYLAISQ